MSVQNFAMKAWHQYGKIRDCLQQAGFHILVSKGSEQITGAIFNLTTNFQIR